MSTVSVNEIWRYVRAHVNLANVWNMGHEYFTHIRCDAILYFKFVLAHWGRLTHICASNINIIGSENDLSPGRRQTIFWTNDGILLFGPLGTNFTEILIEIHIFPFKKVHLKKSSAKWRPFVLASMCFTLIMKWMSVEWEYMCVYIVVSIFMHPNIDSHTMFSKYHSHQ